MKRFLRIIVINIILILAVFFFIEGIVWICENIRIKTQHEVIVGKWPIAFHAGVQPFYFDLDYYPQAELGWGRNPVGLNYKKKPIILFGDSYAFGFNLEENQTFFYKLSELTKRPIYIRAVPGWGIQNMLYQVRLNKFYDKVPEPEYVFYLMINDHFRRLYSIHFLSGNLLMEKRCLRYKLKENKLVQITDSNPVLNFLKRLYFLNKLHQFYINNFVLAPKNYDNYSNFAIEHFVESKQEMEKHWKNTKYVVLFYQNFYNHEDFAQKLEENGFKVIQIQNIADEDLNNNTYRQENYHPTEAAWDLIVPKLVKELNL